MKKSLALLISVLLVLTLIVPATVLASGKGGGKPGGKNVHAAAAQAKKAEKIAARDARKAAKLEAKNLRMQAKGSSESSPTSPSVKPSVEGTKSVGPGVANALEHIIANLARKFAKFGEAVPQGLVNVWFKFSTWLGIATPAPGERPWETSPTVPPASDNPSLTVEPLPPVTSMPPGVVLDQ